MSAARWAVGWGAALLTAAWSRTCRFRFIHDPRPELSESGRNWIYAILHAHQLSALFSERHRGLMAMVSRSTDGDLLAPALRIRGFTPVRGSSRDGCVDKGGRAALAELTSGVSDGRNALLAVDGPRGPRNRVHRGVAQLARDTGTVILPVVAIPSSRWILSRTWDRFQVPKPFSRIDAVFSTPIEPRQKKTRELLDEVQRVLLDLEHEHDPIEAEAIARAR